MKSFENGPRSRHNLNWHNSTTNTMIFQSFFRPVIRNVTNTLSQSTMALESPSLLLTRNATKTHRASYKRWRKTAKGYKRGVSGRAHGNAGWSNRVLDDLSGTKTSTRSGHGNQTVRLKKLLPFL